MFLPDHVIRERCIKQNMIEPWVAFSVNNLNQVGGEDKKIISYGVSSYGYDIRVADQFKIFTNALSSVVDPKDFDSANFVDVVTEGPVTIPPNSFALCRSLEWIKVPRDILVLCIGKSTYARCGIVTNVTPLEPEWEGYITIEVSNTTPNPALIYAREGICQLLFHQNSRGCELSYKDKAGKYQNQTELTLPKV